VTGKPFGFMLVSVAAASFAFTVAAYHTLPVPGLFTIKEER